MSTCNFNNMNNQFPLIVFLYDNYENEDGLTYYEEEIIYQDAYNFMNEYIESFQEKENLRFYDISVSSGYYDGLQVLVEEKGLYPDEWKNSKKWRRKEFIEKEKIKRFLLDISNNNVYGWIELICIGVFSNGEAIYRKVG